MASLLALVSSVLWGVGDFVGGLASRRATPLQVLVVSTPAGWLLLLPVAFLVGGDARGSMAPGIGAGLVGSVAILLLYAALTIGPMGVLSPVSAVLGAGIPVVVGLFLGERPGPLAYVGMLLAVVAIVTVGLEPSAPTDDATHQRVTPRALTLAIASGVGIGLFFSIISLAPDDGGIWPVAWARGTSSVLMLLMASFVWLRTRGAVVPASRTVLGMCLVAGALDVAANSVYVLSLHIGLLSVVSVLGSLYPAATVLLARVFLAERLRPLQKAGMVTALVASALLAIGA